MAPPLTTTVQTNRPTTVTRPDGGEEIVQVAAPVQIEATAPVDANVKADTSFNAGGAQRTTLATGETYLPTSADPAKLWGGKKTSRRDFDPVAFGKLAKQAQVALFAEMKADKEELKGRIRTRVGQLEGHWHRASVSTRQHSLRDYHTNSHHLDEPSRGSLDAQLVKAEGAEQKIAALNDQTAQTADEMERDLIVTIVLTERLEQSTAVEAATTIVEDKGLKTDLLAHAEQAIDPNAPPAGSGATLLEKVADFLHLDKLIDTIGDFVTSFWKAETEHYNERKKEEQTEQRRADRAAQELHKRLEQARRIEQDLVAYVERLRAVSAPRQAAVLQQPV